jgi:hypothetical protein
MMDGYFYIWKSPSLFRAEVDLSIVKNNSLCFLANVLTRRNQDVHKCRFHIKTVDAGRAT